MLIVSITLTALGGYLALDALIALVSGPLKRRTAAIAICGCVLLAYASPRLDIAATSATREASADAQALSRAISASERNPWGAAFSAMEP